MATKKTKTATAETPAPAFGALAALKAAITDGPSVVPTNSALTAEMRDPAIAGAVRKGKGKGSSVVTLGADPEILADAAEAADIRKQMDKLSTLFETKQSRLRDYGAEKRKVYNKLFHTDITTVEVPYTVEVPVNDESETPGRETRVVQVICSNKYSVAAEPVIKGDEALGEWKEKLFTFEKTKVLRPNAEAIFRGILEEQCGLKDEALEKAMALLIEEQTKVSTVEAYESLEQTAPDQVRAFLSQTVTRQKPGLKFPNES